MQLSFATVCALASSCLLALPAAAGAKASTNVVQSLDKDTFQDFVDKNNVTLVKFFTSWCGYCKKLAPEYEAAAKELEKEGVKLVEVDCDAASDLCKKYEIGGYPTLQLFKSGQKKADYEGERNSANIVKYVRKHLGSAIQKLAPDQVSEALKDESMIVVHVPGKNEKLGEVYSKVAEDLFMKYNFAALEEGVYVLKKSGAPIRFDQSQDFTAESLSKWVRRESFPLVGEVDPSNYSDYLADGLPMAYLFYSGDAMRKESLLVLEEAARLHRGKVNFVLIDATKFDRHADTLALPEKEWPSLAIHDMADDTKYPLGKIKGKEAVLEHIKKFVDGKLEPTYRSEEVPAKKEAAGEVRTIVYKNFDEVVMDPSKDVLLELYAPWCGACKRIGPTYEKLAKAYAQHADKVVIAKMDGTANDLPKKANIELSKFPTIILFKAGKEKEQVEFVQLTDKLSVFTEFIAKHGTHKVEVKVTDEDQKEDDKDANKDEL